MRKEKLPDYRQRMRYSKNVKKKRSPEVLFDCKFMLVIGAKLKSRKNSMTIIYN